MGGKVLAHRYDHIFPPGEVGKLQQVPITTLLFSTKSPLVHKTAPRECSTSFMVELVLTSWGLSSASVSTCGSTKSTTTALRKRAGTVNQFPVVLMAS